MRYKFILLLTIFLILVPITITILPGNAMTIIGEQSQEDKDLDILAWRLADCESSQVPDVKILDSNGEFSYSMLQFQQKTFDGFGIQCGLNHTDIYDYIQQRDIFKCMYRMGIAKDHWKICGAKIGL